MLHIVLTFIRQEIANKWYHNTVNDFLLPNTVNQKDEKQYTAWLDDGAILHIKSKLPKYRLKKSSIPQYRNLPPPFPPILTPATKAEGAKLHVCYCSPSSFIPSLLSLLITRTRISACKPDETVVPPSRVFLVARIFLPPCKQPLKHSPVDVRPRKKSCVSSLKWLLQKATIKLDMIIITRSNILISLSNEKKHYESYWDCLQLHWVMNMIVDLVMVEKINGHVCHCYSNSSKATKIAAIKLNATKLNQI